MIDVRPTGPAGDHASRITELEQLKGRLAEATETACAAYRDSARLIRVLMVISQPSSPEVLMDNALDVLSQLFNADVATIARLVGGQLQVMRCCGLSEDDSAVLIGWPASSAALRALGGAGAVAVGGGALDGALDVPASLAGLGMRSAAWISLSDGPGDELLILYRRSVDTFTATELQILRSVAFRLSLAIEARERSVAAERLAGSGLQLTRHLELPALFAEAAVLFTEATGADGAWVIEIDELTQAVPRADHGHTPKLPGVDLARLPGWARLRAGQPWRAGLDGHAVIAQPVLRDGAPVAVLYAFRAARRPYLDDALETASLFASYLLGAMVNAELYHALRQNELSLRLITDSISDLIAVVDADGTFRYASHSHARELGHDPATLLGTSILTIAHPEDGDFLLDALGQAEHTPKVEYRVLTGEHSCVWVETAMRPAPSADGTVVLSSRVIDDRKRLEDELRQRATHDPLTGLANRALTTQRLDDALGRDDPSSVGLLFCDLDKFKAVNDRRGHEVGDELLKLVADRFGRCLRSGDLLARFGGDEFVFLLDSVRGLDDVQEVGERVVQALKAPILLRGEWCDLSVSVGGVCGERGKTTATAMLRDADAAMYVAKDKGRGAVEVFDEIASHRSLDRLDIRSDLAHALARDQFEVYYQPIVDLESEVIVAFEALLRWLHPVRGMIPPDVFIPLAEETGVIAPIGDWVLVQACRQLAAWQRLAGWERLAISVNLSATQLQRPGLAERTLATIRDAPLHPADVWLEVTEHSAVGSDITDFATTLHSAGVHFSLDDFGISYSNLGHLARFPVECLKIDRSFVQGVTEADGRIVRAVLAIAGSLDLTAVAEGIETEEQRAELLRMGCRRGQGYLLSRPVPPTEATALLLRPPVVDSAPTQSNGWSGAPCPRVAGLGAPAQPIGHHTSGVSSRT